MVNIHSTVPAPAAMVDSLSAYEFQVMLDGVVVSGIFSVSGLTSFTLEGERPPLVIAKMVQRDPNTPFNRWIRETLSRKSQGPIPTPAELGAVPLRELAIVAMDEGRETRRWIYEGAYITQVSYSDFDTSLSELVAERITIRARNVSEQWA